MLHADTSELASSFKYRLALRAENAAQVEFLTALSRSKINSRYVVDGSAALHGVFLHGRRIRVIDLLVTGETALTFPESLRAAGMNVSLLATQQHRYSVDTRSLVAFDFDLIVALRINQVSYEVQEHTFTGLSRGSIAVRTFSLPELIARKLSLTRLRVNALDFIDLWLASKQSPGLEIEVKKLLMSRQYGRGSHDPHRFFDARHALSILGGLRQDWETSLDGLVQRVPPYASVQAELEDWLPRFDTTGKAGT